MISQERSRFPYLADDIYVTILLPIRNERRFIERCLGAIIAQDYPAARMEILIADGMSDDGTRDILAALPYANRFRVIDNPRRIQSAGLNLAIQEARGDILVRVDGHTIIAPDYVTQCVKALRATGADNVGGAMDPVGTTPMGKAIAIAGKSPFAVPTAFHVSQDAQFTDTVYLGAWPRSVFDRVGLFSENVGVNEDYELNYRIRESGGKIFFSPDIRSIYYGRQTLPALAKQYFRYGKSKVRTLRKHPASVKPRQLVAPVFVAGLFAGLPLSLTGKTLRGLWFAGIASYLLLNLYFSIKATRQAEHGFSWRVPVVFLTIHLAWGCGFWVALAEPAE